MRIYGKIFFLILLIFTVSVQSASKDPVRGKNGMVVSASDIASIVGIQILKNGGNAVDAAVAVGFALAVTHPSAGNIGGGGFMVIHSVDGTNTTIDYREKAPLTTHQDIYLNEQGEFDMNLSTEGWTSSGIPGSVAGLLYALEKYGTMDRKDVMDPAITLAENGFPISYRLARSFGYYFEEFSRHQSTKNIFTNNGEIFNDGDLFIQSDLANTLRFIRDKGKDGFYDGYIAYLISEQSKESGGYITLEDLKNYQAVEREPIFGYYRGYKIVSMGPPSSGGIAITEALNVLENFNFNKDDWGSSNYIHTVSEVLKYVYADRSKHLGDEDYYPVPTEWLISKEYAKEIASKIGEAAVPSKDIYPGLPFMKESEETTHYSIVDSYGNAVSVTTTLNSTYGNKIVVDGAGFLMNNEMDDFSAKPGEPNQFGLLGGVANSIQPGKRMLSAMTPTILLNEDGLPFMVIGSPGGSTIITVVLQSILNVVDFGMDIQQALDMPRIHHQWMPDRIDYEPFGMTTDVKNELIKKGQIIGHKRYMGRAEGIIIDYKNNVIWGATDPRGYGEAVGY
ncbi:MAG: gamma-glutamyltransferase [Melioribacteraceae bacterium]|nr:gamma-glutamyltransferase [Melioribacteraceae bacterium]